MPIALVVIGPALPSKEDINKDALLPPLLLIVLVDLNKDSGGKGS
jgi:hypothetical protein